MIYSIFHVTSTLCDLWLIRLHGFQSGMSTTLSTLSNISFNKHKIIIYLISLSPHSPSPHFLFLFIRAFPPFALSRLEFEIYDWFSALLGNFAIPFGAEFGCSFEFKLIWTIFSLSQFAYFNPNNVFHTYCERAQSTKYTIQMNARSVFNFWILCTWNVKSNLCNFEVVILILGIFMLEFDLMRGWTVRCDETFFFFIC